MDHIAIDEQKLSIIFEEKFKNLCFSEHYKTWSGYLESIGCKKISRSGNTTSTDYLIHDPSPFDVALIVVPKDIAEKILVLGLP